MGGVSCQTKDKENDQGDSKENHHRQEQGFMIYCFNPQLLPVLSSSR